MKTNTTVKTNELIKSKLKQATKQPQKQNGKVKQNGKNQKQVKKPIVAKQKQNKDQKTDQNKKVLKDQNNIIQDGENKQIQDKIIEPKTKAISKKKENQNGVKQNVGQNEKKPKQSKNQKGQVLNGKVQQKDIKMEEIKQQDKQIGQDLKTSKPNTSCNNKQVKNQKQNQPKQTQVKEKAKDKKEQTKIQKKDDDDYIESDVSAEVVVGKKRTARQMTIHQNEKIKLTESDQELIEENKKNGAMSKRLRTRNGKSPKQDNEEDFIDSDGEILPKRKAKVVKRGVPQNSKPSMPSMTAKKQKEILPEYLQFVNNEPEQYNPDLYEEDNKYSQSKHLLNTECCVHCTNKNVLRAVMTKNHDLLKLCISSTKQISTLLLTWSPEFKWTPLEWVFHNDDMESFDILMEYDKDRKKQSNRVLAPSFQLKQFDTGQVSDQAYGTEVRKVLTARGNRAGNEAFLQEQKVEEGTFRQYLKNEYFIDRLLRMPNLKFEHIEKIMSVSKPMKEFVINNLTQKLLINGKVEIAENIIKQFVDDPIYQVNKLMHSVLLAKDLTELPESFNKLSVNKQSGKFNGIIPLHTAALNPNLDILKRLLNMVTSDSNLKFMADNNGNQCIHYAAACEGTQPLELLLARDFNINYANHEKETPLFIAIKSNRPQNVLQIVQEDEDSIYYKDGHGYYPIHLAAKLGFNDCIRALCKYDKKYVDIPGGYNKQTPLIYAAAYGYLETVQYLVNTKKANVNQVDKFKRNALSYAVRNGHLKIAAFLLQHMAFYNYPDTSLNFPLHYACAYGWLDCVKLLLKAGADVNCQNEWGYTPIMIAMLKNHKTIVKQLLDVNGVDINGTDDQGRTLITYSVNQIDPDTLNYVKYLIEEKNANPHILDIYGNSLLYYAVQSQLPIISAIPQIDDVMNNNTLNEKLEHQEQSHYQLMEYLIKEQQCSLNETNKQGHSVYDYILQNQIQHLFPLIQDQIDFNKNPELLFILDIYLIQNPESKLYEKFMLANIDEKYLNGNINGVNYIQTFLTERRQIYLTNYYEQHQNFDNIIPKDQFFNDLKQNINEIKGNIKYIFRFYKYRYHSVTTHLNKEYFEKVTQYFFQQNESEYSKQVTDYIFNEMMTIPFVKYMQELIKKGADPNQYSFSIQYLAQEMKIPDALALEDPEKAKQIKRHLYIIPISKEQNQTNQKKTISTKSGLSTILSQSKSELLIQTLLDNGLDVNQTTETGSTLLMNIARDFRQSLEFKKFYNVISKCPNLDKSVTDEQEQGFDINFKNKASRTALIMSVQNNNFDQVEQLLEKGCDPNIQDEKGRTALHYAVNSSSSAIDANYDIENILISHNANVNIQDKSGRTPLHYAFVKIGRGNMDRTPMDPIETVSNLCASQFADPKIQDKYGKNVLHYAAQRGATISTMYLEKKGVDLHHKDIFGNTPLATALLCGHIQYAIILIKEGSDVNQLVHQESKEVYEEYKKKRVEERMIDMKEDDGYKSDDSYFKMTNNGYSYGHNPYGYNNYGTGLFGQNYNNNNQNINQNFKEPQTMFKLAVDSGQLGLSYLILDNGFDLMKAMEDSLKRQKFQFVITLLQKVSDNKVILKTNGKGQNLFHIFAQNAASLNTQNQAKILSRIYKQFKRRELDVMSIDNEGRTPLHYAAFSGSYALIKEIIKENDIDINIKDKKGFSPLFMSIIGKRISLNDNFLAFKEIATALKDINQYYHDPLYKDVPSIKAIKEYDSMFIDTSTKNQKCLNSYLVTPYIHLILQYDTLTPQLKKQYLDFMFGPECNQDLYGKDGNDLNALMILVQQNQYQTIIEIFNVWEQIHAKDYDKLKIKDEVDNEGRNIMHHLLISNKFGIYDNVQLFNFLVEKGFCYNIVDKYGKTPFDYVRDYKSSNIYKKLQKLLNINEILTRPMQSEEHDIDMILTDYQIDFQKDAQEYLELNKNLLQAKEEKTELLPDPILGDQVKSLKVVYEDPENIETAYQAQLIKIDIRKYGYSSYVFYKLQLNHDSVKNIYVLLTRWGMIGEQGACQKTPFNNKESAIAEFKKIFKNKTSNNWDERENFTIPKAKGKYILYKTQNFDISYTNLLEPFKFNECVKSNLSEGQQIFMKLVSNIAMYNEVIKLQNVKQSQMNLTNIPKQKLEEAKDILEELEKIYQKGYNKYHEDYEFIQKEIVMLSCKFFQLIPFMHQGSEVPKPLDQNMVTNYKNKIYDLITLERASKIFLGAQLRKNEISPLDYVYKALNINIDIVPQESDDYQVIQTYLKNTDSNSLNTNVIKNIFKIQRQGDEELFNKHGYNNDPHRFLFFHGTSIQNLLGILDCGFKISPMGIAQCGQAFGSGVYFSNALEKSYHYARATNFQELKLKDEDLIDEITDETMLMNRRYIMICEVAMGKIVKYEQSANNYHYRGYQNNGTNYFAIGTQKQLQEILEDLKKDKQEKEQEQQEDEKMDDGYSDQSDEDYGDEDCDDKEKEQVENDEEYIDTKTKQKLPISKDYITELPNGKISLGKNVDITRTLRGHKMMKIQTQSKINRFDTLWVGGNRIPDPQYNVLLKDGSIVPNGKHIQVQERTLNVNNNNTNNNQSLFGQQQQSQLTFYGQPCSEFVVKNTNRIKIRYIVELREMTQNEIKAKQEKENLNKNNDIDI